MKIPQLARYNGTVEKAYDFVMENIDCFPVNPFQVIQKFKWGLCTYTEMAEKMCCSIEDICECFGKDGYSIYNGQHYSIAYNIDGNSKERISFTLMHEIGHIILGHHKDFETTTIMKDNFTENEYKILENEANCFARNVLAPAPLSQKVPFIFRALKLTDIFNISSTARRTRFNFLKYDLNYLTADMIFNMQNTFDTFVVCSKCKNKLVKCDYKYCPNCGSSKLKKGIGFMKYKNEIKLDENKKAIICPKCDNEEILEGPFCKICGLELFNRCSNYNESDWSGCSQVCDANARYCHICGSPTTYYNLKVIPDFNNEFNENHIFQSIPTDDLPF